MRWFGLVDLGLVDVEGTSMSPTLSPGDTVVVRWGARPRPGAVMVARFPEAPGVLVVKRVARIDASGVWLTGDNPAASDDSRARGAVPGEAVVARVLRRVPSRLRRGRQPRASSA